MKLRTIILILITALTLTGCQQTEDKEIVVAEQYGLAYAPIIIMREKGFLEEAAGKDYTVRWEKLGNTAAIREAMLTNHLDVGFMGIPPFLIGVDQEMGWKIIDGLSASPLGLMTNDSEIKDLEGLLGKGKIALPQPGSIQHILLSMAAEEAFGDAKYFDNQLISMKHPDGYQALSVGTDVVAHFTSPPYIFEEMDDECLELLLTGEEAFGDEFTFIVGVCRETFREDKMAYEAFEKALAQSIDYLNSYKEESIALLSEAYELPVEKTEDYLYSRGILYESDIKGVQTFMDFMYRAGYLENEMKEAQVLW